MYHGPIEIERLRSLESVLIHFKILYRNITPMKRKPDYGCEARQTKMPKDHQKQQHMCGKTVEEELLVQYAKSFDHQKKAYPFFLISCNIKGCLLFYWSKDYNALC